jgi:hypothetical protein
LSKEILTRRLDSSVPAPLLTEAFRGSTTKHKEKGIHFGERKSKFLPRNNFLHLTVEERRNTKSHHQSSLKTHRFHAFKGDHELVDKENILDLAQVHFRNYLKKDASKANNFKRGEKTSGKHETPGESLWISGGKTFTLKPRHNDHKTLSTARLHGGGGSENSHLKPTLAARGGLPAPAAGAPGEKGAGAEEKEERRRRRRQIEGNGSSWSSSRRWISYLCDAQCDAFCSQNVSMHTY